MTYIQPDGSRLTCELPAGASLLDGALDNGVRGIIGQCGGGCTCATCHCYVLQPEVTTLPLPHPDESDMLAYVLEPRDNSRLACQIVVGQTLREVVVAVPAQQA